MTFLLTAWTFLKGVPKEVYYGIAALAALWWAYGAGQDAKQAEWDKFTRKAEQAAREADRAAGEAVTETINEVEAGNAKAREAANGSDDPLRSAFDSLRQEAGSGSAAR